MKYYFIADDFDTYNMSYGTLIQVSVDPKKLFKYNRHIWEFDSEDEIFDFESIEDRDPRVKPFNGIFEFVHYFDEEEEFESVNFNDDKLLEEGVDLEMDYEVTYSFGKPTSPEPNFETVRKVLRNCKSTLKDEISSIIKDKIEESKYNAILALL